VITVTDGCQGPAQTAGMKRNKSSGVILGAYSDAGLSLFTFSATVGVLYWVIRLGCEAAFRLLRIG